MKIVGIIAEYNPFHAGHSYHLKETRKRVGDDAIIVVVMSGNFVQRGEPAIFHKWSRAKKAVEHGANLVVELPTYYATAAADDFAWGATAVLRQLGATHLSFGSEITTLSTLSQFGETENPAKTRDTLQKALSEGCSYPHALRQAGICLPPNAMLGSLYLKQMPEATPIIIQRKGNHGSSALIENPKYGTKMYPTKYKKTPVNKVKKDSIEDNEPDCYPSALAIRKHMESYQAETKTLSSEFLSELSRVSGVDYTKDVPFTGKIPLETPSLENSPLPSPAFEKVEKLNTKWGLHPPLFWEKISPFLLYKIRMSSVKEIASFRDITEGFEHRLQSAAQDASNADELLKKANTKRFTNARIKRMLLAILLNIKKTFPFSPHEEFNREQKQRFRRKPTPSYLRVLAFDNNGRKVLNAQKQKEENRLQIEIITKLSKSKLYRTLEKYDDRLDPDFTISPNDTFPQKSCTVTNPLERSRPQPLDNVQQLVDKYFLSLDLRAAALYATLLSTPSNEHQRLPFISKSNTSSPTENFQG